ncbi:CD209 antigen-like protein C [Labrus bergylta]|uniref:CD209 antigen-like protein A n=1 Tax=Labrus bergylta TaxID=56723 RepID=A0A3Q3NIM7_9LABR|nr:CD209 antigen-like protein A [Labrus bergylta]XP_020483957.1 CD209 antigen-like protein A [Labrus bergylta]XP_020512523.1 CD209 antigen-like protein A [Labrus bergylta]XP_020512524.1 CD209 antigen-like protein A [Labrus bergylta]
MNMVRFISKESSEIMVDYVNVDESSSRITNTKRCLGQEVRGVTAAAPGGKLLTLVAVSFGVLCFLQVALNISLRLTIYTSDRKTTINLTDFDPYFQRGWVYFRSSLYFISSLKKPWQESRVDCLQQGADLVIINSREEQDFIRKFYGLIWIGLTRRGHNGTWRWVDGTPLTKSYWSPGEPNEFEGKKEDCVEIKHHEMDDSWNDIPCEDQNFWICEKMVAV